MNDWPFDPDRERYVNLATYRRNGKEVRTPVCIARSDERFYVYSEGKAGKVKRIRANGKARLAACNIRGVIRSDWLTAQGRIVDDSETIERAYVALREKYGWLMKVGDFYSKLIGHYHKRAIIELRVGQERKR
jgi:PPOX class probable F420-dependent enzyme